MGADIIITEVDETKTLTDLDELKTPKVGGGYEYWVRKSKTRLTTKNISKNGTYPAASDGYYGFKSVTVNVSGGNGSADSHGKPTGGDIKPGGAGSAVTGTDPETGEEVVVGVDENGNIVQTQIPYGIKIVTPPTKTAYTYQEDMDYSGIGVKLTNKNGDTYTDVDHPSGWYVNPEDLIFPVEKAPAASGQTQQYPEYQDSGIVTVTSIGSASVAIDDALSRLPFGYVDNCGVVAAAKALAAQYPNCACSVCAQQNYDWPAEGWGGFFVKVFPSVTTGTTVNLSNVGGVGVSAYISQRTGQQMFFVRYEQKNMNGLDVGDGGARISTVNAVVTGGTATIPVQWNNPYTGATHQDTFQITSTSSSGSSSTTTGSAGQEGSGGGGSF